MAEMLSEFVNGARSSDMEAFAEQMMREHRTLQQSTMNLFMTLVEAWDKCIPTNRFDERNAAAVKLARKILNETGFAGSRLPHI
jgi:hypothetical protein